MMRIKFLPSPRWKNDWEYGSEAYTDSLAKNIKCREAFDRLNIFKGDYSYIDSMCDVYGALRVGWILALTVRCREKEFPASYAEWASKFEIPDEEVKLPSPLCIKHPADIIVDMVRAFRTYALKLAVLEPKHCIPNSEKMDYAGRILLFAPGSLPREKQSWDNQLFLAIDGRGCNPNVPDGKIRGYILRTKQEVEAYRSDFYGIVRDNCLLDWVITSAEDVAFAK